MRYLPTLALLLAGATCARAAKPADCWTMRKHGQLDMATHCFELLTQSPDAYFKAEGYWGLEQWEQASAQFRLATQPATSPALIKVRWGMLLHERFNDPEAADLFHEALAKDPANAEAFVGLAMVSADGFDGKAMEYAAMAIELDPKLAEAYELRANLALQDDDRAAAAKDADLAIALEADALDAMAIHAALELIADRPPDTWFAKIAAINPGYGKGYAEVAHDLEMHYRYEDAAAYYRKAVEADPRLWSAHSALGIELMRLGKQDEPLHELELSYNNGYRDAATVNSLRLLDSYKKFDTFRDDTTILKLNKSEAELLRPYFEAELHTILATY
jgi:tetratricopeptide (TPR) repeat protein